MAEGTSSSSELPDGTRDDTNASKFEAKLVCDLFKEKQLIIKQRAEIIDKTRTILDRDQTIREKDEAIYERDQKIREKDKTILEMDQTIREKDEEIRKMDPLKLKEHLSAQRVELDKHTQWNKEFMQQIEDIRTQLKTQIAEARTAKKALRKMNCEELEMRQLSDQDLSDLHKKLFEALERLDKEADRRIQEEHANKMYTIFCACFDIFSACDATFVTDQLISQAFVEKGSCHRGRDAHF